uniref:STS14 protein-like n=1 Tax=Elaeis guineensis var. tenera TaxID=51953 RepID=A0A6I9QY87_ELAGV|nr:STS14 protein-like [Elaeis guineensis]
MIAGDFSPIFPIEAAASYSCAHRKTEAEDAAGAQICRPARRSRSEPAGTAVPVRACWHVVVLSTSTASPPPQGSNATERLLAAHNQARAAVGVWPQRWSPKLGADTSRLVRLQWDKKGCEFAEPGANRAWSGLPGEIRADAVGSWVGASKYHDRGNNTWAAGHDCARDLHPGGVAEDGGAGLRPGCRKEGPTLINRLYYPHGNVQGQTPY